MALILYFNRPPSGTIWADPMPRVVPSTPCPSRPSTVNTSTRTPTSTRKIYRSSFRYESTRIKAFLKWAISCLFSIYFCLFKQTLQFSQQINVKNVNPVYSAGIRTHNQSPPITTRPGLPPKTHNVWINF